MKKPARARPDTSGEFDSLRVWRRVIVYSLVVAVTIILGFAVWAWLNTLQQQRGKLRIEARLTANSARALFAGLANDLPYLSRQINAAGLESTHRVYALLSAYQRSHPGVASLVLFSPGGSMRVNTARPCCAVLPDTRGHPGIYRSLLNTLHAKGLWIGQTQKGLVLGKWRIPIRYVIRSARGEPRAILQASVLLKTLTRQWHGAALPAGTAVGLIRTDGVHIARLPASHVQRLYSTPADGPLMAQLKAHPAQAEGGFGGVVFSDSAWRIGEYVKLDEFPLVAYASIPLGVLAVHWGESIAPVVALVMLSLAGFIVLSRRQIMREQRHVEELALRRRRSAVTGLPNRFALMEWLDANLARGPASLMLLRVDLDDFHDINAALGPDAGDRALQEAARRIRVTGQAAGGFVTHAGGDKFDIALPGATLVNANGLAQSLLHALGAPLEIDGRMLRLQAGIGIGCYPQDAQDSAGLLRVVDSALYGAKRDGKSHIGLYDPVEGDLSSVRLNFQHAVERALAANEFVLHFQPIVDMQDGRIVGAEALVRWLDPERGMVPPAEFIPLAEATGRIGAIGQWVFHHACRNAARWLRQGHDLHVAVNLSAVQFASANLAVRLREEMLSANLAPSRVVIEVTETAVMQDVERSLGVLNALHALGIGMAIDDFGTGYSSLAYLRRLPAQTIKIDQSFVRDVDTDSEDLAIVRAIVALARALGRKTVAEGIENAQQWKLLQAIGVDYGQGYWLGRPVPEDELRALLGSNQGRVTAVAQQTTTQR
ncbi:EAL domain-containing protein [Acidihalobacter ferrooxydans]|uniref:bifunctional diguanylate cyclase/phosphodiesterase n=1 Tax=Acidihalobacter ferrooxydans TaxID=1765967 RepID=UPI0018DCD4A4|nr:EAL domain-containing protein [Acidihalobacter ferrooxydans]